MSIAPPERLVYLANQIAGFFAVQKEDGRAAAVADHLKAFWAPRMREGLIAIWRSGGEGLHPLVRDAAALLDGAPSGAVRTALEATGRSSAREPGDDAG